MHRTATSGLTSRSFLRPASRHLASACGNRCLAWRPRQTHGRGLLNLRLLARDETGVDRATVAGILLCANSPQDWLSQATIAATHYRGLDRSSAQLDAQEIAGPLAAQIAAAVQFVVRNMRVSARKTPEREDVFPVQQSCRIRSGGQRSRTSRLLHVFAKDPAIHVQGPPGDRFARPASERHDYRRHGGQPGHP